MRLPYFTPKKRKKSRHFSSKVSQYVSSVSPYSSSYAATRQYTVRGETQPLAIQGESFDEKLAPRNPSRVCLYVARPAIAKASSRSSPAASPPTKLFWQRLSMVRRASASPKPRRTRAASARSTPNTAEARRSARLSSRSGGGATRVGRGSSFCTATGLFGCSTAFLKEVKGSGRAEGAKGRSSGAYSVCAPHSTSSPEPKASRARRVSCSQAASSTATSDWHRTLTLRPP
mmetsp:Transcript_67916/g.202173  ORF Transcript_67916/g.202173 Transcript_67916/m.202173 type:complete len:231 (-) Transcript_67916:529-1221(-)